MDNKADGSTPAAGVNSAFAAEAPDKALKTSRISGSDGIVLAAATVKEEDDDDDATNGNNTTGDGKGSGKCFESAGVALP